MLNKSPLVVKNADLDAQIHFMFEVAGTTVPAKFTVPSFWKYGVFEPASSDVASARREEEKKNLALQRRIAEEELALARYAETLFREEAENAETLSARRALYLKKEEELELLNQKAMLEKRAALLKKEQEQKRLEQENAIAEAELENQRRLVALRERHESAEQEILDRLAETDTEIAKEENRAKEFANALDQVKSEFLDMNRLELRERQANEKRVFEAYDKRNVLEVKEVYLYNVNRERYVLYLPTMSVRKGKVTVMTAVDPEIPSLTYKTLFRAYGTNLSMRSGEVRIDGIPTTSVLKQDFKKTFGHVADTDSDYFDLAAHSSKSALKTFSLEREESRYRAAAETLGISPSLVRKPFKKLTDRERETLAYAAAFLSKTELTAFLEPFRKDDPKFNEGFLTLLDTRAEGKAFLILTTETEFVLKLSEFSLYRLE